MTIPEWDENRISIPEFIRDSKKNDQSIMTYNMYITNNIHYRYEIVRFNTFKNWTVPYIKSEKLSAAGFYFTGRNETIKCFECHLEISKWPNGVSVVENHKIFSPKCRFARKLFCDNVPIEDKRNVYDMEHNEFMLNIEIAKYPNCRFYQTRFNSFALWPLMKIQTGQQLAEAGFSYTGQRDKVVCFYCGLILKEWIDYEDPWEAHYKWASTCFYILTIKGEDYLHSLHEDAYERERRIERGEERVHASEKEKKVVHYVSPEKHAEALENIRIYVKDLQSSRNNIEDVTNNISPTKDKSIKNKNFDKLLCDKNAKTNSRSDILCIICFEKERNMLWEPCCHILTCVDCCKIALKVRNNKCSFCGEIVKESIKIKIV